MQEWSQLITSPEQLLYPISALLWYPVLIIETAALVYIVFEAGRFSLEMVRRDRHRSLARIEHAARTARTHFTAGKTEQAVEALAGMSRDWLPARFVEMLGKGADLSEARLEKMLSEIEDLAAKRLGRTRVWIRLGPIIGLVTTLIPISPALVGLAKGDLETLSSNLVIAFSTTVIGLFISGVAFVMSSVRERLYLRDVSDVEYALDLLEA